MVIQRLHVIRMTKKPCHFLKQINPIMQVVVATALAAALIRSVRQRLLAEGNISAEPTVDQLNHTWIFSIFTEKRFDSSKAEKFSAFSTCWIEGGPFYFWNVHTSIKCIFYCVIILGFHILHNHLIISLKKALPI